MTVNNAEEAKILTAKHKEIRLHNTTSYMLESVQRKAELGKNKAQEYVDKQFADRVEKFLVERGFSITRQAINDEQVLMFVQW